MMVSQAVPSQCVTITLAQMNSTVGDLQGNTKRIIESINNAKELGSDIVLFPELALTGYPPEDLLLKPHFLADVKDHLGIISRAAEGIVAIVGTPVFSAGSIYNAAAIAAQGSVREMAYKTHLPNYEVFDEKRYFTPSSFAGMISLGGVRIGITICEDLWLAGDPLAALSLAGALLVVNISASPYSVGRGVEREACFQAQAKKYATALAVCNITGGQDELVFDGQSLAINHTGQTVARARQFDQEELTIQFDLSQVQQHRRRCNDWLAQKSTFPTKMLYQTESLSEKSKRRQETLRRSLGSVGEAPWMKVQKKREPISASLYPALDQTEEIYTALICGLHDYVKKNGFHSVILGLSGGIDSALVALLAADALGSDRVTCVVMPSPHSSDATQQDARQLAQNLGVMQLEFSITQLMAAYENLFASLYPEPLSAVASENLQARIRGNLLMALSNTTGALVLTTGNKSELAVGYSTLYGDSAGGFAVIKDCPKLLVYELVRFRNASKLGEVVPETIISREPSAELRPDQLDSDSLPPYEQLDEIILGYVEHDRSFDDLVASGHSHTEVAQVIRLIDRAEYKRRQYPPGVRITPKAFGRDRRMPITNLYKET